ncbi:hypothetical protein HDF16_000178 [Granulicella aggregans]|uniref:Thiol:disulfide interchange protein DsbD N-terminal domain-containing protein n=1 Tax=Granulicella aggregans TaxID=474949 RepID=A0A7W7Z8Z1_9BACT|nr:protein-disulfide reductase DsbD domain-containing protein [Granulicella aggregans]MBB5055509.1 hypothetical protein [Granulicella aggregans]
MKLFALAAFLAASAVPMGRAQDVAFENASKPKTYLVYAAEPQTIAAGKRAVVELHFKVQDGFHVNSHTPKSELLIPTNLKLDAADGVKAAALEYPAGVPYSFSFEPNEKLDVYQGAFIVKLPVMATRGEHVLTGTLRYQACDHAACYPPKTLPVQVMFTAK